MEKPLFRLAVRDPRRSVSDAAVTLQSGFFLFAVTAPQVALRKTPHAARARAYVRTDRAEITELEERLRAERIGGSAGAG